MYLQRMEDVALTAWEIAVAIMLIIAMVSSFAAAFIFIQAAKADRVHNVAPSSGYVLVG